MDTELWKATLGFPGYDVSSHGRVRSYWRRTGAPLNTWKKSDKPQRILSPARAGPYDSYNLRSGGKYYQRRAHRLVLLAFRGPCPLGLESCHNDGNKKNNHLDNLRYDTHTANLQDASRQTKWVGGEAHGNSHYTDELARQFREEFASGTPTAELAQKYNVPRSSITQIVYGRLYKEAGGPIAKSPRLSDDEVEEIRYKRAGGDSLEELSMEYGLSISTVSRIALGQRRTKAGGPIQNVRYLAHRAYGSDRAGEKSNSAKFTNEEVERMRESVAAKKMTRVVLATKNGVSEATIGRLICGKTYKDAGGPITLRTKLSDDDVREIRRRIIFERGPRQRLALEFNVSLTQISRVLWGSARKDAGGPTYIRPGISHGQT